MFFILKIYELLRKIFPSIQKKYENRLSEILENMIKWIQDNEGITEDNVTRFWKENISFHSLGEYVWGLEHLIPIGGMPENRIKAFLILREHFYNLLNK
jgi:hypothetical protein